MMLSKASLLAVTAAVLTTHASANIGHVKLHNNNDVDAQHLRGGHLHGAMKHAEGMARHYHERLENGEHPIMEGVEKMVAGAHKIRDGIREKVMKIHYELLEDRKELAARLAEYEEGNDDMNFSLACAKKSMGDAAQTTCSADTSCVWCTKELLTKFGVAGLCASAEDKEKLVGWGLSCGAEGASTPEEMLEAEFDLTPEELMMLEMQDENMEDPANYLDAILEAEEDAGAASQELLSEEFDLTPEEFIQLEEQEADVNTEEYLDNFIDEEDEEEDEMMYLEQEAELNAEEYLLLEEENEMMNLEQEFSFACVEQRTQDACTAGKDEDGTACVWCQYNTWLGACVESSDTGMASDNFAMTCGAHSMN